MTFKGVVFQESKIQFDQRGTFRKSLNVLQLDVSINFSLAEVFHSVSKPGTFRGLHLQIQDSANLRNIALVSGHVIDVLMDLRAESESFLNVHFFDWDSSGDISSIMVPPGVAHGFLSLEEATMVYASNKPYNPQKDTGVNPFTLNLPFLNEIREISDRDLALPSSSQWALGEISV
jgi:dTDP-4-dehydrorhamnose 3,5-epimerase-like enzyme